jgi:hypothetical protein
MTAPRETASRRYRQAAPGRAGELAAGYEWAAGNGREKQAAPPHWRRPSAIISRRAFRSRGFSEFFKASPSVHTRSSSSGIRSHSPSISLSLLPSFILSRVISCAFLSVTSTRPFRRRSPITRLHRAVRGSTRPSSRDHPARNT